MKRITLLTTVALLLLTSLPASAADVVTALPASRDVQLTAFTRARASLELVAESDGKVLSIAADIGDAIPADGIFARLDPTFIKLDLQANQVMQQKLASRIAYDEKEAKRYRDLVRQKTASQSQLDTLEQTLDANEHELSSLKVQEQVLREKLARTVVRAPAGWKIMRRDIEPGQWVSTGQQVGEAGDFRTLLVPFAFTPEQYEAMRRNGGGKGVVLHFPERGLSVPARVEHVNPGFDPQTRKIVVDLAVSKGLDDLRGGLRAQLTIAMADKAGAVLLPPQAVEERYEDHWVTRASGERVRVVLLGNHSGPNGSLLRITGDGVRPGDSFRLVDKE